MNNHLVSIIIPTYKRSTFLERAIESVLNQTYKDIEIIVVDDNDSKSEYKLETQNVMKKYSNMRNVKYIHTSGSTGGGAARNYAIKECTGDYVAFLDDDDIYLPDKLEKQLTFMIKNKLDLSYQDVKWVDENDKLVEFRRLDYVTDFNKDELLRQHILHSLSPTAIYMIKRESLLKTDGFGEVLVGQDFILMLRCIEAGFKIGYMSGAYVIQYLHSGERLSLGRNKISGENYLYELKKKYYYLLRKNQIKYVDFRHYAVLAFACLRSRMFIKSFVYALRTFIISPIECYNEAKRYFGNRK